MATFDHALGIMKKGVEEGVFPGAVLLAGKKGEIVLHRAWGKTRLPHGAPVTKDTCFDLASLTKPLATALAVMDLVRRGKMGLDDPLGRRLEPALGTDKANIPISSLLRHTAGFPAWRPLYLQLEQVPIHERKAALDRILVRIPLECPPGTRTIYSDLGYLAIWRVVETVSGATLDHYLKERLYGPLNLDTRLFFLDAFHPPKSRDLFAATEKCPWRNRLIWAEVHDENAWILGGAAGHAGLFGTAKGVWELLFLLMEAYHGRSPSPLFPPFLVRRFLSPNKNGQYTLGFDTPSPAGSAGGARFSKTSVGHLGFTGTSFWMDLEKEVMVILLTNRVHPRRDDRRIRVLRPLVHDAVMEDLCGAPH